MPSGRAGLDELDGALGQRRPGRDRVHADPVRAELERHRLRQPPDRVLRRAVVREPGAARVDRVDRRDVDDRAAVALLPHLRRGGPDAEERAADVDAEDAVELGRRHVLEQEVREHAGVVDEHVEPAEALDGGPDQRARRPASTRDVALGGRDGRGPRRRAVARAPSSRSARRSASTTAAPASARRRAHAKPNPCAAPVTSATLPLRSTSDASDAARASVSARRHGRRLTGDEHDD